MFRAVALLPNSTKHMSLTMSKKVGSKPAVDGYCPFTATLNIIVVGATLCHTCFSRKSSRMMHPNAMSDPTPLVLALGAGMLVNQSLLWCDQQHGEMSLAFPTQNLPATHAELKSRPTKKDGLEGVQRFKHSPKYFLALSPSGLCHSYACRQELGLFAWLVGIAHLHLYAKVTRV